MCLIKSCTRSRLDIEDIEDEASTVDRFACLQQQQIRRSTHWQIETPNETVYLVRKGTTVRSRISPSASEIAMMMKVSYHSTGKGKPVASANQC
mmetsp:Transcript_21351/g.34355  ORF Transcript_21351/g.34355 Transcript_21351/m.34355 type:complete len:94 (+) Transcript_21351:329-610(+)